MREIKFRAKDEHGEWVFGSFFQYEDDDHKEKTYSVIFNESCFIFGHLHPIYVIPETVGQFTGLLDKNGKEIYEGDILHYNTGFDGEPKERNGVVTFDDGTYRIDSRNMALCWYANHYGCEVLGNIHDNPELLKGENHE